MRPVSGDDLVTAALQSSLARAQKNYKFDHHKKLKGPFGIGNSSKLKKEEVLPIFNTNSNKGKKGLKFQSEFDLWREQASDFTFSTNGLQTNGASVPKDIDCLNARSSKSPRISAILKQQLLGRGKESKMKDMSENGDSATSAVRARPSTPSGQSRSLGSTPSPSSTNGGTSSNSPNQHQLPQPKRTLYPRDKIIPGYIEKLPVGAGFFNMGNSCYLNASLQAVFHVPAFINWLKQDGEHRNRCQDNVNCIICAMKKTLDSAMGRSNVSGSAIRPVEIINRLRSICRHFSHGRQEDAHEFLRYLFESMERSYLAAINCLRIDNRSKETNPLGQIFGGYLRTEVTCLKCHYVSTTFQPTAELQLDIRHVTTLEDAILNHFKKERLDNNDYKCEKCRTISQATKQFSLEVPPIVLCLQLKRFTLYGTKIAKRIHCNQHLDMSKYIHKSKQLNGYSNLRYRLAALVTHLGSSPNCGHYTAIAQAANGSFYQFDDSFVHQVSVSNALNNDAYVIIYEMDSKVKKPPVESSSKTASSSTSGYNSTVNKLSYPSSTAAASNSSSASTNSIYPKKLPSTPIPKISALHSTPKLVQNDENEVKQSGLPMAENMSSGSANGRVLSTAGIKPAIERKMISFGIRTTNVGGTNKINIIKPGVPLTNSSKLVPASSGSTNDVATAHSSSSLRAENKSDPIIKLVPYNDDENEESDKDENLRIPAVSNNKRLTSPENHRKQSPKRYNIELPATPPKSPKQSSSNPESRLASTTQSSVGNNSKKRDESSTDKLPTMSRGSSGSSKSGESTYFKDSNKRKSPENEAHDRKSRSHKRRSSSSSSSQSEGSSTGRGDASSQNKRKRDDEVRSSPDKKSSSHHSSSDHGNHRDERDPRDSAERDEERRKNRNPSRGRSRSPSADHREIRGSSSGSGPRALESNSSGGGKFDTSSFKQENSIVGWNGQKSVLSRSMEEDRKRSNDKTVDEEYDDEFDQGRTKKVRRSRSLPRETESGFGGNRFQNVEDKKKKIEEWTLVNGYSDGGGLRRNSSGSGGAGESKSWFNGGHNDPSRHKRNFSSRSSSNNGFRPRHSSTNGSHSSTSYSQNSHGRSPFRNGHHSNGHRSQSQSAYHNGNKHWGNDRNRR